MRLLILLSALIMTTTIHAQVWDKTLPQSDRVTLEKEIFKNRYDIDTAGDLYNHLDLISFDKTTQFFGQYLK